MKLTTARLSVVKLTPGRSAGATNVPYTKSHTFLQVRDISQITIKRIFCPIFPAIYARMKISTVIYDIAHLTMRFTTTKTSLLIGAPFHSLLSLAPTRLLLGSLNLLNAIKGSCGNAYLCSSELESKGWSRLATSKIYLVLDSMLQQMEPFPPSLDH